MNSEFLYKDGFEHFLTNSDNAFRPKQDTVYFMSIEEAEAKELPDKVHAYHLKYISWEDAQRLLANKVSLEVYQVVLTKFKSSEYLLHFIPATISKEGLERHHNNACIIRYKKQKAAKDINTRRCFVGLMLSCR